jgi:ATP-dependent Clp protease protease subunit
VDQPADPTRAEPSGGARGQATDIALVAKEILRTRSALTDIYADHCTRPGEQKASARDRFETALERDYYMTAEEAREFGIVDKIVERRGKKVDEGVAKAAE